MQHCCQCCQIGLISAQLGFFCSDWTGKKAIADKIWAVFLNNWRGFFFLHLHFYVQSCYFNTFQVRTRVHNEESITEKSVINDQIFNLISRNRKTKVAKWHRPKLHCKNRKLKTYRPNKPVGDDDSKALCKIYL